MPLAFRRLCIIALLALLAAGVPLARPAHAAGTFTVTKTADTSGTCLVSNCSLREAITAANSASGGTVAFNIPTGDAGFDPAGYWTIKPLTPLPALSSGSILIDGTTQPGGRASGPKIVIDGSLVTDPAFGNPPNGHGIKITSANNTIKSLVINNFPRALGLGNDSGGAGVYIVGTAATGNRVLGCYIGTTPDGNTAARNSDWGVLIDDGASSNTIGGTAPGEGNLISGNSIANRGGANVGIGQVKANSTNPIRLNVVVGNLIGTNAAGTATIGGGNLGDGVKLASWAQSSTIGGITAATRNVIAGHDAVDPYGHGVIIASQTSRPNTNNVVLGNYIGTDRNGALSIKNRIGVRVTGSVDSTIGGTVAGSRNIIAGNGKGVVVENNQTSNITVVGNWIGLRADGAALGNGGSDGGHGVEVKSSAVATTIGPDNVISANAGDGVQINVGGTVVKGNYIGTDSTGTTSVGFQNGQAGIRIAIGQLSRIGGPTTDDRNVIALGTNGLTAIWIIGSTGASNNTVEGNYIGMNAQGTAGLVVTPPPGSSGILLDSGTQNNTIGGTTAASRNIISGNNVGVQIKDAGTSANKISGNWIGVNASGNALPNTGYGIRILNGATGNTIGGSTAGEGNLVARNSAVGISVEGTSNNNLILRNSVRNNGAIGSLSPGIRITTASGIKISQTETADNDGAGILLLSSGNGNRAAPTNLQLNGQTLTGDAPGCPGCTIEIFTSPNQQDGEGPRYLGSTTADGSGGFAFVATGCDAFLTATATDGSGNTSPFAPMIGTCQAPQAGVQLDPASPPSKQTTPGVAVTYQHTLRNTGTASGAFTISASQPPSGWTVQLSQTSVNLAAGASTTIVLTVTPPANATVVSVQTTVTATVGALSDAEIDTTTIAQVYGVKIGPKTDSGQITPPGFIDYTHVITNTGNGPDTITLSEIHTNPNVSVTFPNGNQCASLAPGATCTRVVRVTAAAGATGADTTTVTATSSGTGNPSDSAQDTTTFITAAVPQITTNPTKTVLPGDTVTFVHTVTNIGNITGNFTLTLLNSAPAGWSFAHEPAGSFSLAPGATKLVTVTITTASGASAPNVGATATAQAQVESSSGAIARADDTAQALLRPAFTFSPATQPTVNNSVPGRTVPFTHTLTNNGNGPDTFTILITPTGGLTAAPIGPITLARNESRLVVVQVQVPAGQGAGSYTVDVSAQTNSTPKPAAQTQTDTIIVVGAAVPLLSPSQTRDASPPLPTTVSFTHILTNTGNQAGTFSLAASVVGAPAGWSAAPSQPSCSLVQNASCTFTVNVTVPAGATAGLTGIVVTANYSGPPPASDSVTDFVRVPAIPGVQFTPDNPNGDGDPGEAVVYIHTLTNTGNGTDSFTITLQTTPGWLAQVTPQLVVNVPRGETRTVTVTVTVPRGVVAGTTGIVTATATSALAPHPTASVVDVTSINAQPGAELIPAAQTLGAIPTETLSDTVTFVHQLRNTGSISLTYVLTKADSLGWTSVLTPTEVGPLAPGQSAPISLTVTAPAGTPFGSIPNVTTISVREKNGPATTLATAVDTTTVGPRYGALLTPTDNYGAVLPGATRVYTHTLANTGATTDTFLLSVLDFSGWDAFVAPPSIDLGGGQSTTISVTVQVPTSALSGTLDLTTVFVQSTSDPTVTGNAREHTTVLQVVGLDLAPGRARTIAPSDQVQFVHTLINTGNGVDTFTLTATNALGWPVALTPGSITLAPGETFPAITVNVQVPAGVTPGAIEQVTITATSRTKPSVTGSVRNLLRYPQRSDIGGQKLYLPITMR